MLFESSESWKKVMSQGYNVAKRGLRMRLAEQAGINFLRVTDLLVRLVISFEELFFFFFFFWQGGNFMRGMWKTPEHCLFLLPFFSLFVLFRLQQRMAKVSTRKTMSLCGSLFSGSLQSVVSYKSTRRNMRVSHFVRCFYCSQLWDKLASQQR